MNLPETIKNLITAQNERNSSSFANLFSKNAIVYDEGDENIGTAKIERWNEMTTTKYETRLEALEMTDLEDEKLIVFMQVSGVFDGSPIRLKYEFEMIENEIASLRIG